MRRTSAFTFIELLILVAIIMVLAALLSPALNKVAQQARITSCASNQKQLAAGVIQYADDNRGLYPERYAHDTSFTPSCWARFSSPAKYAFNHRPAIDPYVPPSPVIVCPELSQERIRAVSPWHGTVDWHSYEKAGAMWTASSWVGYDCYASVQNKDGAWGFYDVSSIRRDFLNNSASTKFPRRSSQFPNQPIIADRLLVGNGTEKLAGNHMNTHDNPLLPTVMYTTFYNNNLLITYPAIMPLPNYNFAYPDGSVLSSNDPQRLKPILGESISNITYCLYR